MSTSSSTISSFAILSSSIWSFTNSAIDHLVLLSNSPLSLSPQSLRSFIIWSFWRSVLYLLVLYHFFIWWFSHEQFRFWSFTQHAFSGHNFATSGCSTRKEGSWKLSKFCFSHFLKTVINFKHHIQVPPLYNFQHVSCVYVMRHVYKIHIFRHFDPLFNDANLERNHNLFSKLWVFNFTRKYEIVTFNTLTNASSVTLKMKNSTPLLPMQKLFLRILRICLII